MKNILIINHYAGCPKYGEENRHYLIGKELLKRGYQVCIIASSVSHLRKTPKVAEETIDGIHFQWIKTPKYKKYGFGRFANMALFSIKLFFKEINVIPDFVIVSSPSPFPILNALKIKNKFRSKLIYEIRDIWPKSIVELGMARTKHPIVKFIDWLDSKAIKKSDVVLSPLQNIQLYLDEKGYGDKEVIIIPNGISSNARPSKIIQKRGTERGEEIRRVGYGGSISASNSVMNLLRAAKILKDEKIFFEVVGDGSSFEDVKEFVKKNTLSKVFLHGRLSKEEMVQKLGKCDFLYKGNPPKEIYKYGVSSLKLPEYLLLKKPVIDASYDSEVVKGAQCGVVVGSENACELAKGIKNAADLSQSELNAMGQRGFEFAMNNYVYEKTVTKLIRFLERDNSDLKRSEKFKDVQEAEP